MTQSTRKHYFIFNGDADGICAAHQFYLNRPMDYRCQKRYYVTEEDPVASK
jgi:hypothetical protein